MKYGLLIFCGLMVAASLAHATESAPCPTPVTVCEEAPPFSPEATNITMPDGMTLRFVPTCRYGMSGGVVYDAFTLTGTPCTVQKIAVESYDGNGGVTQDTTIGCKDLWQDRDDHALIRCSDHSDGYRVYSFGAGMLRLEEQVEFTPGTEPDAAVDETVTTIYKRKH